MGIAAYNRASRAIRERTDRDIQEVYARMPQPIRRAKSVAMSRAAVYSS